MQTKYQKGDKFYEIRYDNCSEMSGKPIWRYITMDYIVIKRVVLEQKNNSIVVKYCIDGGIEYGEESVDKLAKTAEEAIDRFCEIFKKRYLCFEVGR